MIKTDIPGSTRRLSFNQHYLALTILLFVVEVLIALFVHDRFVRPYLGDVLVVILMYCFVKSFLRAPDFAVALGVLIFSFAIEFFQYINLVEKLGWQKSALARTVMGTSFAWMDLLAYTAGFAIVLVVDNNWSRKWS